MLYLAQHIAAVTAFLALSYLAGWGLERLWLHRAPLGGSRNLARWGLGFAFWMLATFTLAAAHALNASSLRLLAVAVVGIALVLGWRERSRIRLPRRIQPGLGAMGLLLLLLPHALLAAGPRLSWDAAVYHLTLPRLFLEHGGFRPAPFLVYAHWPLNGEMLYTALLGLTPLGPERGYPAAGLLHFAFGLLTLYAMVHGVGGPRRQRRWAALWAACFFLANGVVLDELRVAYVDLILAFFVTAAVIFLTRGLRCCPGVKSRAFLILAGICSGVLAGLKVSGFLLTAAVGLVLVLTALRRWGGRAAGRAGVAFTLPAAILALPWMVKTWVETGNPAYPFLYEHFGGPAWSPAVGEQFAAWQRGIGMGREPMDYLLLPWRVIAHGGRGYTHFDGEVGLFWLFLLPLTILMLRRSAGFSRPALTVSGVAFVLWAMTSQQLRFLLPILPLLAVAAALALTSGLVRLPIAPRGRRWTGGAVSVAALLLVVLTHATILAPGYRTLAIYTRHSPAEILASARPPVFAVIDRDLAADARLLMLYTNQGFYCRREFVADSFFEASQIADWLRTDSPAEVARRLAEARINYVLVARQTLGELYPPALLRLITDPRFSTPHYHDGQYALLQLNLEPAILSLKTDDLKENKP